MLRIVFFGTPDFAVPTLDALLASCHRVVGVVTQPDRPRGRGHRMSPPPVKVVAERAGLPVWQPVRLKDPALHDALRALTPDLGVVAAYGRLIPDALLDLPRLGLINVHASLLPAYRGASPIQSAIIAGEGETGVTIMRVVTALDAGGTFARIVRPIGPDERSDEVEADLARLGARLLVDVVDGLETGRAVETPQDDARATYAPRLTKAHGTIDWSQPAIRVHDRVRGVYPWPQASVWLGAQRLALLRTSVADGPTDARPGTIVDARGDRLVVACGAGTGLAVLELQPEGRRAMTTREFLAGHRIEEGTVLGVAPPA
jgi:methionyl-tRNA formyltransferase